MARAPKALDDEHEESLARRAAEGDNRATHELVTALWPSLIDVVRACRPLGPYRRSDDHVHAVALRVAEKLSRPSGAGFRPYPAWRARNPDKTLADWLHITAANAARDHVRRELGRGKSDGELPNRKRLLNEAAGSGALEQLGLRPPITAAETARQILELARARLPAEQLEALRQWLEGGEPDEIARSMSLPDEATARKLMRAAVATLRRHFAVRDA